MNNAKKMKIEKVEYERPNHLNDICDVTIEVGNKKILANRSLLIAMNADYFKDKFSDSTVIRILNVSEEGMEALVTFSRTGKITITRENAASLLRDADVLKLTDVKNKCVEVMKSNLDASNIFETYRLGKSLSGCNSLFEHCKTIIRQNLEDVSLAEGYASLNSELLESILSDTELHSSVSPELMFEAIMRWVLNDFDNKKTYLRVVDTSKLNFVSPVKSLFKDEFKVSLGSKHNEIVTEVMSIFSELIINAFSKSGKSYIYVENCNLCESDHKAEIYDFTTEKWTTLEGQTLGLPKGTFFASNDKLYRCMDKKLHVFNFKDKKWVTGDHEITSDEFHFNETYGNWSINSWSFGAVLDDYLYVMATQNRHLWRFSFKTSTWSRVCSSTPVLSNPTELVALQGFIYAISISSKAGGNANHFVEIIKCKPESSEWTPVLELTDLGVYCGGAVALNGKIYLIRPGLAYDLEKREWTYMAPMNTPRENHLFLEYKGKIWAIGGYNSESGDLSSVEVYDPVSNSWTYGEPMKTIKGAGVKGCIFFAE